MKTSVRIALTVVALGCITALTLLLLLNDAVREVVLDPIVAGIAAARYMLGFMSQDLLWLISLSIGFVLLVVFFVNRLPSGTIRQRGRFVPRFPNQGPAMTLVPILEKSSRNKFAREQVILSLRDLAARSLAYHAGLSIDEAKASLDTTQWATDSDVCDFLSLDKHRTGDRKQARFQDQVEHALAHIERTYQEV